MNSTNVLTILTSRTVIASPKGAAISYFGRLLRRPGKAGFLAMTVYLMRL